MSDIGSNGTELWRQNRAMFKDSGSTSSRRHHCITRDCFGGRNARGRLPVKTAELEIGSDDNDDDDICNIHSS